MFQRGLVIEKLVVVKISGRDAFFGAQALCDLMVRNCIFFLITENQLMRWQVGAGT